MKKWIVKMDCECLSADGAGWSMGQDYIARHCE